jgi:hypothetical protein
MRSRNSTGGNDPIYPEVILAIGLRFVGLGDTIAALMDIYGTSRSSTKRAINMFNCKFGCPIRRTKKL